MLENLSLTDFHFLRPVWLLVIPFAIFLYLRMRNNYSAATQWHNAIAPHLLTHLTKLGNNHKRLRPYQLFSALLILFSLSLSGPTFNPKLTPYTQDQAPLIIALELNVNMLAKDQPPTRIDRAKQKIRDILKNRVGARTAVIAYAGSAHTVLPLTDDAQLIEIYLDSLHPLIMPQAGDNPTSALLLAENILSNEKFPGTVLFMTDGIDRSYAKEFDEFSKAKLDQVLFLAFGSNEGGPIEAMNQNNGLQLAPGVDMSGLQEVAKASNGTVVTTSIDDSDVNRVLRLTHSHLVNTASTDEKIQWHDAGYYLVWLIALLSLFWFRRGWTIQWQ